MRVGIPGIEEETYFSSYFDSSGMGTKVRSDCDVSKDGLRCVLMQSERVVDYGSR